MRRITTAAAAASALLLASSHARRAGGQTNLPLEQIKLPPGFSIAVYADHVPDARSLALAPDGTVFVGNRERHAVYALVDRNHDQRADELVKIADGMTMPNGVAFKDGALYVAEVNRVLRFDGVLAYVKAPAASRRPLTPTVINSSFPSDGMHGWKYLAFGPDGLLYLQVGAPCNICDRGDPYATIWRMKPDGSGAEIFARGVRNSVGMAWHPDTKELWFTDNGRDNLGDDVPPDELNRASSIGLHFGYPYCHAGTIADPQFGAGHPCSKYTPPARPLGSHVAALGLTFYTGTMFPQSYRKQIFIAEHGSWNRSTPIGYRISIVRLEGNRAVSYEPFAEGWLQGRNAWGRPVDVLEMPDGALLVSDDEADVIYRIAYSPTKG